MQNKVDEVCEMLESQDENALCELFGCDIWDAFVEMETIVWKSSRGIDRAEQMRRVAKALLVLKGWI